MIINDIKDLIARRDAFLFAVGVSTSIIELALFATTPSLGTSALEIAFATQVSLSFIFETSSGFLVSKLRPFNSIKWGYILKILSTIALLIGIIISTATGNNFVAWSFMILFFITDACGSGILQIAFRAGYAELYSRASGNKQPLSFLNIFTQYKNVRTLIPFVTMILVAVAYSFDEYTGLVVSGTGVTATLFMFACMISFRCVQIYQHSKDGDILREAHEEKNRLSDQSEVGMAAKRKDKGVKSGVDRYYGGYFIIYIFGNTIVLSILMYLIGDAFRIVYDGFGQPDLNWFVGGMLAVFLHSSVIYFGQPLFRIMDQKERTGVIWASTSVFFCSLLAVFINTESPIANFVVLSLFSIVGLVAGNSLLRLASSKMVLGKNHGSHAIFVAEFITNIIMLLMVAYSHFSGTEHSVRELIYAATAILSAAAIASMMLGSLRAFATKG
ncbi:hypothetical protein [Rhizobium rhizogenes]|uniref:hypothetical protein n=1 Tax=Rhizobium rhizogenes TaxID=359 RepID=UPI0015720611|nr:hypothetical protein [Rhizobium rhizogenes]NTF83927.1 hypothetical protein [Rhizobium rhizogenes]